MAGRKTLFLCGHRGRGQFCHRYAQEQKAQAEARAAKTARQQRIEGAPIYLEDLPTDIAEKTLQVMAALSGGESYLAFKGKRFTKMGQHDVISVPIGRRYRLICRDDGGALAFVEVLSHERYNSRLAAGGWPR